MFDFSITECERTYPAAFLLFSVQVNFNSIHYCFLYLLKDSSWFGMLFPPKYNQIKCWCHFKIYEPHAFVPLVRGIVGFHCMIDDHFGMIFCRIALPGHTACRKKWSVLLGCSKENRGWDHWRMDQTALCWSLCH